MIKRKLTLVQTPPPHPGFLGRGHTARAVIQDNFSQSDPFILLMDDRLIKEDDEPVGGPHPHAGFETVTLILEGQIGDTENVLQAGDLQMMTAGSGVVHTETIETKARMWILQLWLTLPKKDRWAAPRVQDVHFENIPKVSANGTDIRLYSGSLVGLSAPLLNYVPVIIADIQLEEGAHTIQQIPASFNTFLYIVEGSVAIGEEKKLLQKDQVGWLDKFPNDSNNSQSELELTAGPSGGRLILYAGQPQGDPIVSYGPFIGDTQEDIYRLYQDYRQGKMGHISDVAQEQKMEW